jgi:branched-chain amino acid transport system permease protein
MGVLLLEQTLNGLQFSVTLFLIAAGLTLVFGVMNFVNLAHGSLFMVGAYFAAWFAGMLDSFWLGLLCALPATALVGLVIEVLVLRHLYAKDHMVHVLATFALILIFNDLVRIVWGPLPLPLDLPSGLASAIQLGPVPYSSFRLVIMLSGVLVGLLLWFLVTRTRIGMWVRAGANNREMAIAMGVNVKWLYTAVFTFGTALSALAGVMLGPLVAVEAGMGDGVLILAFVVVVIGGIGSILGAAAGALIVGVVDTLGRTALPALLSATLPPAIASSLGSALGSMMIYLVMVLVLFWRPSGLFPANS